MSVYQRFIESASSSQVSDYYTLQHHNSSTHLTSKSPANKQEKPKSPISKMLLTKHTHSQRNQQTSSFTLPDLGSISTPISKLQYKRLVEADHQAIQRANQQHCNSHKHSCTHSSSPSELTSSAYQARRASRLCHMAPSHQQHQHQHHHHHQSCSHRNHNCHSGNSLVDAFFKTDDPVLLEWLQAMRFETELECLTSMQARTLTIDEYAAGALSVRNSQVSIQEMRLESNFILDYIDYLIESLPLKLSTIGKFSVEFSELWTRIVSQTSALTSSNSTTTTTLNSHRNQNTLTIYNCTPRKFNPASTIIGRPLDRLAIQIRSLCMDYANLLYDYQENPANSINNGHLEATLRKLKELHGKFTEISIRAQCANIVQALRYDFSQSSLNRLSSSSSLVQPARPFECSSSQLPLKWALIALWQLTKDDAYICTALSENWETSSDFQALNQQPNSSASSSSQQQKQVNRVSRRLDYSTKDELEQRSITRVLGNFQHTNKNQPIQDDSKKQEQQHSLRSDYEKLYQICQNNENFQQRLLDRDENGHGIVEAGALSSALKSKQQQPVKQVSTIELLIDIIISQPNKHERIDMMSFIQAQTQNSKLIDINNQWDQETVSAAFYTSNQYKVAALRILNHLCVNEQAIKTILKCFSTPPPRQGQPLPENKIIRSIFECYQTSQEHIYQNETLLNTPATSSRKRLCKIQHSDDDEYSDYGSRNTNTSASQAAGVHHHSTMDDEIQEGDDIVVKEAIRLLVQLTIPFHRSNKGLDFYTLIGRFSIDSLVKYLTNIIKSTASREMLFLSLTALANISFITTEPMIAHGTNRIMLEMFRSSKSCSKDLELRDQAVTILANTADKNLLDIVNNAGLTFLLSCLQSCPNKMTNYRQLDRLRKSHIDNEDSIQLLKIENKPRDRKPIDFSQEFPDVLECDCDQQHSQTNLKLDSSPNSTSFFAPQQTLSLCLSRLTENELAALERIHQKTAVAFARMSADTATTRMILKYGGIKQMIDLCKFSHKRNHSDTVLIACIAALRKMSKVIESDTFRYYNALDLIELELNQALEIYGNPFNSQQLTNGRQQFFVSEV